MGRVDPGDLVVRHVQGDQRGQGGGQAELWQGVTGKIQDLDRDVLSLNFKIFMWNKFEQPVIFNHFFSS